MDLNDTVPEYKETTEESVKETERYFFLGFLMDGARDGKMKPL